jgi:hypothetical protein
MSALLFRQEMIRWDVAIIDTLEHSLVSQLHAYGRGIRSCNPPIVTEFAGMDPR